MSAAAGIPDDSAGRPYPERRRVRPGHWPRRLGSATTLRPRAPMSEPRCGRAVQDRSNVQPPCRHAPGDPQSVAGAIAGPARRQVPDAALAAPHRSSSPGAASSAHRAFDHLTRRSRREVSRGREAILERGDSRRRCVGSPDRSTTLQVQDVPGACAPTASGAVRSGGEPPTVTPERSSTTSDAAGLGLPSPVRAHRRRLRHRRRRSTPSRSRREAGGSRS